MFSDGARSGEQSLRTTRRSSLPRRELRTSRRCPSNRNAVSALFLRFTPDSFHSLPLRRGSEASLHCRALSDLGLPAPYYFYTFNFPTPATLVPPHYSLCSFFLEQSHDCLHLCNFPLRLSPYAAHLSPVPLAPFSRRVARPTNGGSVLSCCVGQLN